MEINGYLWCCGGNQLIISMLYWEGKKMVLEEIGGNEYLIISMLLTGRAKKYSQMIARGMMRQVQRYM